MSYSTRGLGVLGIFAIWVSAGLAVVSEGASGGGFERTNDSTPPPLAVVEVPLDFPGTLYVPAGTDPHPGVLLLHGLEGAADRVREARQFAEHGYAALALCWLGCGSPAGGSSKGSSLPALSAPVQNIDLSQTYEALRWLRTSQFVQNRPTALYGVSLGAEHALVLTMYLSKHPEFYSPNALILHAPTDRITSSSPPAWAWQGDLAGIQPGKSIVLDRYSGSLLITHGLEDQLLPVASSRGFEKFLRGSGTAVRTYLHHRDPGTLPWITDPDNLAPARADFHYFRGEGNVFTPAMEAIRLNWVQTFLKEILGG